MHPSKRRRGTARPAFRNSLLAFLFAGVVLGQQLSLQQYGQEQGLVNLVAQCMLQDRTGFLWVGTQSGLFRYNGYRFRGYSSDSGLPAPWIGGLHETADGTLWVATRAGVARRVGDRFLSFPYLGDYEIQGRADLASDAQGTLFVGTSKGLLVVPAPVAGSEPAAAFQNLAVDTGPILGVHVDAGGAIWLACRNRVLRVDRQGPGQELARAAVVAFGPAEGLNDEPWSSILSDLQGNIWVRSREHLVMLPKGAGRFIHQDQGLPPSASDNSVLAMDGAGMLFAPTDLGLAIRNGGQWDRIDSSRGLPGSSVGSFLQDREGSYWIGLSGGGLARWVGAGQWEAWTRAEGLSNETIWSIRRDATGTLWAGTDYGLNYLPRGERVWRQWKGGGLDRTTVRALALARDGTMWTGTGRGEVAQVNPRTGLVRLYGAPAGLAGDKVMSITFDQDERLWVATRSGLYRGAGPPSDLIFESQNPPGGGRRESFTHVVRGSGGAIWATGYYGLVRFQSGKWTRFTMQEGLPGNRTSYVTEAPDGAIWIAYRDDKGISRLVFRDGVPTIKNFTTKDGLRSHHAVFLRSDARGWIWSGTDNGVEVFDGHSWRHYGRGDGLVWADCDGDSFLADEDGSVWIGTSRGLSHFRPPATTPPTGPTAALVTGLAFGGKPVEPSNALEVSFPDRSMQVHFTALTFLNESEVRFRYRLVNLHEDWIETSQREVAYPGLGHGPYRFEVIARNAAGVWSGNATSVSFRILPPWWKTWWFNTLGLLLALTSGRRVWRIRVRSLLDRQQRLEDAVAARTSELVREKATVDKQNSEIELLLEQAQEASRAKSAFLANMSHEIRTPLNGVFGMTELVLGTELSGEQREYLQTARDSADALLGILNDVLDLSKIEAGRLELDPAPFSPDALVRESAQLIRLQAQQKNVSLAWEVDDAVPEVLLGDAIRLRQVLLNLLGNAIKFTSQGSVTIRVAMDADHPAPEDVLLRFTVVDTGIGIPVEKQSLIFEAFRQADSSTTRKYGGSGLGLAICSRLVGLMSGRIWVESEAGQGSTFHFTALLKRCAGETILSKAAAEPIAPAPQRRLAILLAEDNAVNQKVAVRLLESRGHSVTVAGNGREAVSLAAASAFDAILMDVNMPEMDGLEATQRIREAERTSGRHVPIIAMTACAMSGDREKCLLAGMDTYTDKPINRTKLLGIVESLAETGASGGAGCQPAADCQSAC